MEKWQERALECSARGMTYKDIAEKLESDFGLDNAYRKVRDYIYKNRKKRAKACTDEGKHVVIQNQEPEHYKANWGGDTILRFGLMGDTQFGSKYAQITRLHEYYELCKREGITDIYHTGDITDGLKMRPGHEYELYLVSADELREDVTRNYPKHDGITTHFITGNHDASIYKHVGYDIGQAIAKERPDMKYLGRDCAVINLTPNCSLEMRHPWDGTAYAISYKIQKMIEAMDSYSKPSILAVGHYHKQESIWYRNIHAVQTGCFQSQTPFLRGKGVSVALGGFIIEAHVDETGTIRRFKPEFISYKAVTDDYKNFK